jgi:hypothetical protein
MRRFVVLAALAVAVMALVACSSSKTSGNTTAHAASASSGGGNKFCTDAATNNLTQQLQANAASNANQGAAGLQKDLNDLKQYESEAPSAIKSDVTTLVNYYAKFVQILTNDQGNPSKLASDFQAQSGNEASLNTAVQHIEAYYTANCHG